MVPDTLFRGRRPRVLLVDDEASILRSLKRLLRREPYEVSTAGSGAEALKVMEQGPANLVISDQRMSGMTGTELLKQAKADPRRIDLAASWINRTSLEVEANARRIAEGTVARVERCEKIVDLAG